MTSTTQNALALALVQAGVTLSPTGKAPRIKAKASAPKASAPKAKAKVKVKALTGTQVETIASIAPAAFQYARSKANVITLVKAIGAHITGLKACQRSFNVGYIAYRLHPSAVEVTPEMLQTATIVLDSAGKDAKKLADGQTRRTVEQEKAYGAARTAWKVILREAETKPADARGGKRKARTPDTKASKPAMQSPLQVTPRAKDSAEITAYLMTAAATHLAYMNKNAKPATLTQLEIVNAFHAAVMKLTNA